MAYTPRQSYFFLFGFLVFFFTVTIQDWIVELFLCAYMKSLSLFVHTTAHQKRGRVCLCSLQALPERGCRSIKIICQWRLASGFIAPAHSSLSLSLSLSLPQASIYCSEQFSISTEKKEYTQTHADSKSSSAQRGHGDFRSSDKHTHTQTQTTEPERRLAVPSLFLNFKIRNVCLLFLSFGYVYVLI
jgi:hypothetical protein